MKKNTIVIIALSIIIVILLNYIIFSTALKTSIVEFLKLPILGSIVVALVSIITVYLTNSFNLKKMKLENANSIHKVQFEKEFQCYNEIWNKFSEITSQIKEIDAPFRFYFMNPAKNEKTEILDLLISEINKLPDHFIEYQNICEKYFPFIPYEIYILFLNILDPLHKINGISLVSVADNEKFSQFMDKLDSNTIANILSIFTEDKKILANKIQQRIENLKAIN